MAQRRFIEWQAELISFDANEKYAGILSPNVYRGFDSAQGTTNLTFQLNHNLTGERFTKQDGTLTPFRGIWVSRQGTVIKEDANIPLSILANPNNFERWDVLVGDHIHDDLNPGGLVATYTVIPGGNRTEPTGILNTQVIIGRIRVPANATTSNGIIWERRPIPQLGGKYPAILAEDNRFTAQNQENHSTASTSITSFEVPDRGIIQGLNGANSFKVTNSNNFNLDLIPTKPLGTIISLTFNNDANLRGFANQIVNGSNTVAGVSSGYSPLSIMASNPETSLKISAGETTTFRMVSNDRATNLRPYGTYWSLISITDAAGGAVMAREAIENLNPRMSTAEQDIAELQVNQSTTSSSLTNHIDNKTNPHQVTKAQVGLSNIPNAVSERTDLDSNTTLATSKAVKTATDLANEAIAAAVPTGAIIMWSGPIANIPENWTLCDGKAPINGQIIPDLRGRMIIGAVDPINPNYPARGVDDNGQIVPGNNVNTQGGISTLTLQLANIPPHTHTVSRELTQRPSGSNVGSSSMWWGTAGGSQNTSSTGGSGGSAQPMNILPPYYALAFIIKVS